MAYLELTEKDSEQLLIEKEAKKLRDDLNHDPQLKQELFAHFRGEKKLDDVSVVAQDYLRDISKVAKEKKMKEGDLRINLKNILLKEIEVEAQEVVDDLSENTHYRNEVLKGLRHEIIGPTKKSSEGYNVYMLEVRKICEKKSLDFRAVKQKIYALLNKENAQATKENTQEKIGHGQEDVRKSLKRLGVVA